MTARAPHDRPAKDVVAEFFEAYARRDVDALMSLLSEDIVEDLPGVGVVAGADQERAFLTALFESFPDLVTEVRRIVATDDVVAVELQRRGTFTGRPWQGLPASGKPFEFRSGAFIEVDDARITRIDVYSDTAQFARDIGVLPPEGSAGERLALTLFRTRVRANRVVRALVRGGRAGS